MAMHLSGSLSFGYLSAGTNPLSASMASKIRIAITTGDSDGIGPEVATKAVLRLGPQKGVQLVLFRAKDFPAKYLKQIKAKFKTLTVNSLAEGLWTENNASLIDVAGSTSPAHWVELAARMCMEKQLDGIATGPISKTLIRETGMKDIGHTEILARVSGVPNLYMGFYGSKFCVVLATGHIPLAQVTQALTSNVLSGAFRSAQQLRTLLPKAKQKLPLALVGLNPHAGEGGMLGGQELWFKNLILGAPHNAIAGPLVPDAAFLKENWLRYSVYICPYHDQGLIPFKMAHGFDDGVHLTLGLPFVRTSVDHGTAKDIAGKGKARFGSMKSAIEIAIRLAKEKKK
jgi:4-hydroxythreonine-4-phosphate dehydrogenase